jgi:signal transduction histidine kinase
VGTCAIRWVVALIVLSFAPLGASAQNPRHILLLYSFGTDYAPWNETISVLRADLDKRLSQPIEIYEASIFGTRLDNPGEQAEAQIVEYLGQLFSSRKLDLVVSTGAPAARFIQRHRTFAGIPLLFGALDPRNLKEDLLTANDAVVGIPLEIPAYLENVLRLRPEAKSVSIGIGNSGLEQYWISEMRREFAPLSSRVKIEWWNNLSFDDLLRRAANLTPESAILYMFVWADGAGVSHPRDRVFAPLRAVATVPVFAWGDYHLGRGAVGGPLAPLIEQGHAIASGAVRILQGERPGNIRVSLPHGPSRYDWRELRRWGISEALLPPGSVVEFREPGLWKQYRWQLMLIAAAVVMQSVLIMGLLSQRQRRRTAEVEARRRMGELAVMNRRIAIGETSASIAHEIKQPLSAIVTNSDVALGWLAKQTPDIRQAAAALERIAGDAYRANKVVESVRAIFKKEDQNLNLLNADDVIREVLALIRIELEEHGVALRVALSDGPKRVLADRIQLQQVVLNLVRNAIEAMDGMTGRPRVLTVGSAATETELVITVEDTGPGIDPDVLARVFDPFFTTKSNGMGMGLAICKSIAESHGGRLSARPAKSEGAVFEIILPLPQR